MTQKYQRIALTSQTPSKQKKIKIALLQDISKHFKTPRDFHLFSHPDGSSGVLVHKTIPSEINSYLTSKSPYLSTVGVLLYPEGRAHPISVISVYRKDYDNPRQANREFKEWLPRVLKALSGAEFCVGGDFNAKHPSWGHTQRANPSGKVIAEAVRSETNTCRILNDGSFTRSAYPGSLKWAPSSAIDVTLVSKGRISFGGWKTHSRLSSDHNQILFTATLSSQKPSEAPPRPPRLTSKQFEEKKMISQPPSSLKVLKSKPN